MTNARQALLIGLAIGFMLGYFALREKVSSTIVIPNNNDLPIDPEIYWSL